MRGDMTYVWSCIAFLVVASVSTVAYWAWRSFLRLQSELAATQAQLANKEGKERDELARKLHQRRANILMQPVMAIAPPAPWLDEHILGHDFETSEQDLADGRGYLSAMRDTPYSTSPHGPDTYHSVRPLDYWKHYLDQTESAQTGDEYHGYSKPQHVNSESLTNPLTTQHSINWNNRCVSISNLYFLF